MEHVERRLTTEERVEAFFRSRFAISKRHQERKGVQFEISFEEYMQIWKSHPYRFANTRKQFLAGKGDTFMRSDRGYVLTWISKDAKQSGVMTAANAEICGREESKRKFQMQKGEQHREDSKHKIAKAITGIKRSDATKALMSAAQSGMPKSAESNAKRAETMRAYWDKRRADKANQASV